MYEWREKCFGILEVELDVHVAICKEGMWFILVNTECIKFKRLKYGEALARFLWSFPHIM